MNDRDAAFEVGQRVWVYGINDRGRGPTEGIVTKVGRKLVTVGEGWQAKQFRIEDGTFNHRDFPHHHWIKTDEQHREAERRAEAIAALAGVNVKLDRGCTLTVEQLEALAAVAAGFSSSGPEGTEP